MNMIKRLDSELIEPLAAITAATGGGFSLADIPATRAMVSTMIAGIKEQVPPIAGVRTEDLTVPGPQGDGNGNGNGKVPLRIYRPEAGTGALPVLIWMHGGGYVLGDLEIDDLMLRQLCADVGCAVVGVDYRLAPEHPFPAAIDDCHAAAVWVAAEAGAAGFDPGRIGVGGASAGGGLAAALALMARDRGSLPLAFQLLIYPALDDRNVAQVGPGVPENLFWSRANVLTGWRAYLGGEPGSNAVEPRAAAMRAERLDGLPPAYIAAGEVDMFVTDSVEYARRLIDAGVRTELHIYPGAFHAFDAFAPMSRVAGRFVADRNAALREAFSI